MRLFRRLFCFLGVHRLPDGVTHARSLCWACVECGALVTGGLGSKR